MVRGSALPSPARAGALIAYAPDAGVLAEALAANVHYFVTLDRQHFPHGEASALPFPVGTPGDFLAWFRARLVSSEP